MKTYLLFPFFIFLIFFTVRSFAQVYPPDKQLASDQILTTAEPVFGSVDMKATEQSAFTQASNLGTTMTVTCIVKVLLEGALDALPGTMYNKLQQHEVLPPGQPYNIAPWNYQGTEGAGWQTADYPANTVDWVLLSFRESPASNSEVAKVAAPLLADGNIVPVQIPLSSATNSLYVVVEHRNHLPAMSPMPVNIVNNTLTYNFTSENSYPGTSPGQKLINNYWCLFAGNGYQTSGPGYDINGADKIPLLEENGDFGDYFRADYNLDADVTGADKAVWYNNNGAFSLVPQ